MPGGNDTRPRVGLKGTNGDTPQRSGIKKSRANADHTDISAQNIIPHLEAIGDSNSGRSRPRRMIRPTADLTVGNTRNNGNNTNRSEIGKNKHLSASDKTKLHTNADDDNERRGSDTTEDIEEGGSVSAGPRDENRRKLSNTENIMNREEDSTEEGTLPTKKRSGGDGRSGRIDNYDPSSQDDDSSTGEEERQRSSPTDGSEDTTTPQRQLHSGRGRPNERARGGRGGRTGRGGLRGGRGGRSIPPPDISDGETVQGGTARRVPTLFQTRCTIKLKNGGGTNAFSRAVSLLKEFLQQLQTADKFSYIAPWYNNVNVGVRRIETPPDLPTDPGRLTSYFPRFMNRKIAENTTYFEYVSINIGHSIEILELIMDLGTWLQKGEHAIYVDMLQCERKKEAGFFTNSYFTMDLEVLRELIEGSLGCKVGLRWKPISGTFTKEGEAVRAIHVEVDHTAYTSALRKLSEIYGKSISAGHAINCRYVHESIHEKEPITKYRNEFSC